MPISPISGPGSQRRLLHVFHSFAIGGAQSRLVQLIRAFEDRFHHTIVSLNGRYEMAGQIPAGLPVAYVDFSVPAGLRKFPAIRQFIAARQPDVLVTYNWGAIEWAAANRFFPLVRHVHVEDGFGPEERDRQLPRRMLFRRLALGGKETVVVLPSQNLLRIARTQWKLRENLLRYIANGIDCARFAIEREPYPQHDPVVIGTVATLRPEKNLQRMIAAFARAKAASGPLELQLLIVGAGPERERLEAFSAAHGCTASVQFTGATETPEKYLAKMDIYALSSDTEQMPLGVLEAMASGLPVASTDVGDLRAMVAPENIPYISKLADEAGLGKSFTALAKDSDLRARLGRLNRKKAEEEFDYRQMASKYAALFA